MSVPNSFRIVVFDKEADARRLFSGQHNKKYYYNFNANNSNTKNLKKNTTSQKISAFLEFFSNDRIIFINTNGKDCNILMFQDVENDGDTCKNHEICNRNSLAIFIVPSDISAKIRKIFLSHKDAKYDQGEMPPLMRQKFNDFHGWQLDIEGRSFIHPLKGEVKLTYTECGILEQLLGNPGRPMSRDALMRAVHGRGWEYADRSIDITVARLRKKTKAVLGVPLPIKSIRNVGYLLEAESRFARNQLLDAAAVAKAAGAEAVWTFLNSGLHCGGM